MDLPPDPDDPDDPVETISYWDWSDDSFEYAFNVALDSEAIPVNFHQDAVSDIGDGNLTFHYAWDSSTGNTADLTHWQICESVTYAGNSTGISQQNQSNGLYCYFPPDPFVGAFPEPTQLSVPATDAGLADDQICPGFSLPYKEASFGSV